jgi:hypothetical protein
MAADGPGEWRPASAMLLGTDSLPVRFTDPAVLQEATMTTRR